MAEEMNHRGTEAQRADAERDPLTSGVIGAAIEVHKALGPGLLESLYEECMAAELADRGMKFERQVPVPVVFKGKRLDGGYRLDFVVENRLIVEIKAVERLLPVHEAQLLSYLKLTGKRTGLLLNFHTPYLRDGIKRLAL